MTPFKLAASRTIFSALLLAFCLSPSARAAFVLNVVQSGSNVVATGSGPLNTTALTIGGSATDGPNVWPSSGAISVGSTSSTVVLYTGISGPVTFGSGPQIFASSGSGNLVAVIANIGSQGLYVPAGYTSNSALSGTATWNNQTIAGLGLAPGTYTYTWGSGATADSFVLNISAATPPPGTPAPSSLYLVMLGILSLALVQVFRRRRSIA
jgi:hypothetical protein